MLSWNSALNSRPLQPTQREEEGGCEWLTIGSTRVFRSRVSRLHWAHMYFVCCECFKGLCIFLLRKASVLKLAIVLGEHFGYLSNGILHHLPSQPGLNLAGCKLGPWRVCTCVRAHVHVHACAHLPSTLRLLTVCELRCRVGGHFQSQSCARTLCTAVTSQNIPCCSPFPSCPRSKCALGPAIDIETRPPVSQFVLSYCNFKKI